MNETTSQMSLLDAIGMPAPEETKKPKKDKPAKPAKSEKKARKKAAEASEPVAASTDTAMPEPAATEVVANTPAPIPAPAEAVEAIEPLEAEAPDGPIAANDALPLDQYLCFALYSANHAMHGVYKALLKEAGLTYPQFLAMTVLWENNNVPVGTITAKLQLDTNTLTPLLKRLEAMGLVTRTRNPKDERQVILKLTRKGRALQKKTEHFSSCILSSTGLKLEEVMDLQSKIMRLRDNLREAGVDV
ncbi:MarR family winged helix-turn-helix transcriptional regulator [Roseibium sediminicola]|uniref:MarR family transcriptional regulator n=1 Tax=Roseibium sediminicola TaxID=2933272 RepID=A0ABT0GSG5_9HYPH|nr:MarR family transcriptional regulator [Roseibium sp. CAU 1639]MCK7612180.1 MarR family transcriptional regulator [Roseibium sp. CAU 1639]